MRTAVPGRGRPTVATLMRPGRFTVVGAVFHLAALFFTIILSYLDLAGRVLIVWAMFFAVSTVATLATVHAGFAWYGWGYLAGAVMATDGAVVSCGVEVPEPERLRIAALDGHHR